MPYGRFDLYGFNSRAIGKYAATKIPVDVDIPASAGMGFGWPVMRRGLSRDQPSTQARFGLHGFNVHRFAASSPGYGIVMSGNSAASVLPIRLVTYHADASAGSSVGMITYRARSIQVPVGAQGGLECDFIRRRKQEADLESGAVLGWQYILRRGLSRDKPPAKARFGLHRFNVHGPGRAPSKYDIKVSGNSDTQVSFLRKIVQGATYDGTSAVDSMVTHVKRLLSADAVSGATLEHSNLRKITALAQAEALAGVEFGYILRRSVSGDLTSSGIVAGDVGLKRSQYIFPNAGATSDIQVVRSRSIDCHAEGFAEVSLLPAYKNAVQVTISCIAEAGVSYVLLRSMTPGYQVRPRGMGGFRFNTSGRMGQTSIYGYRIQMASSTDVSVSSFRTRAMALSISATAHLKWENGRLISVPGQDMSALALQEVSSLRLRAIQTDLQALADLGLIPTWPISVFVTNIAALNPRDTYITSLDRGV